MDALGFLSSFDWYEHTFEGYIWDVPDEFVNDDDIKLIFKILSSGNPSYVAHRLIFHSRWNLSVYPKLNIRILLDYLSTLDDVSLPIFIENVWSNNPTWIGGRNHKKTDRIRMLESLEGVLDDETICSNDCFHNLFELMLYILICTKEHRFDAFKKYYSKYKNIDMLDRVCNKTKSKMLIVKLEEIKRML